MHHLVERGRDEAGQANAINFQPLGFFQDCLAADLDAEVVNLVVVAAQDHTHNVFANVVHISLDCGQQNSTRPHGLVGVGPFSKRFGALLSLHERDQVGHSFFHDTSRFDDLRQEHLAAAKQVPDNVHSIHERSLNHVKRPVVFLPCFLRVLHNELVNSLDQRMLETLGHVKTAPFIHLLLFPCHSAAVLFQLLHLQSKIQQLLHMFPIFRTVQNDGFAQLLHLVIQIRVNGKHPSVHNRHVQPLGNGVVQENAVHCLTQLIVAAERE
mmetsp:Transcript_15200/g.36633  ORF Transcript_15200/g.36633 Transcript_15200/m.36633 type:complete len:268 (-) Transcript_15200:1862-2665(-)